MAETNKVADALRAAEDFVQLRSDIIDVMKDGLSYSYDASDIEGFASTAESIIALFADRLSTPPAPTQGDA